MDSLISSLESDSSIGRKPYLFIVCLECNSRGDFSTFTKKYNIIFQKMTFLENMFGSVSKESTCNAGDPGSIPGSGRSPGEGIGYPLQYRLTTPVFLGSPGGSSSEESACDRTNLGSPWGWEDPLEEGMATHSSILVWRIPMDRRTWWTTVHGVTKSQTLLSS